jgi:hypothetical protein
MYAGVNIYTLVRVMSCTGEAYGGKKILNAIGWRSYDANWLSLDQEQIDQTLHMKKVLQKQGISLRVTVAGWSLAEKYL